jgi:hypothetical protein
MQTYCSYDSLGFFNPSLSVSFSVSFEDALDEITQLFINLLNYTTCSNPVIIAAHINFQNFTNNCYTEVQFIFFDPGIFYRTSLAKYAASFF